jgi:bifunctional UDP-N-acetylglucosamine pyrophosphorylase/glucosamine-1-phosphate N-acetyltransferase
MANCMVIILAAGQGTRMKSDLAKVLHHLSGRPMIAYVAEAALSLNPERLVMVVGHQADEIKGIFSETDISFALQAEQLGTGHAVACAADFFEDFSGPVVVACGDVPLVKRETLDALLDLFQGGGAPGVAVSTTLTDATGYGRIVCDENGKFSRIVEHLDAAPEELEIREVNAGLYCFDAAFLREHIKTVTAENAKREFYLTDLVEAAYKSGSPMSVLREDDSFSLMGINSRAELARAQKYMWRKKCEELMRDGVTIMDPESTYIDNRVEVGRDTVIYPSVFLLGDTGIGPNCTIMTGAVVQDSRIEENVQIKAYSTLESAHVHQEATIGPFARLREASDIRSGARIGNFVEVKKSVIGAGAKASHLSYIGDASVGEKTNIGAGTITCNYDGVNKWPTDIGEEVFIGSNTALVAPVKIGKGAIVGAGSTITKDVPPDKMAVARGKQAIYRKRLLKPKTKKET